MVCNLASVLHVYLFTEKCIVLTACSEMLYWQKNHVQSTFSWVVNFWQDDESAIKQSEQGVWDPFSVEDLLHRGVASQLEALQIISVNASKEYSLEKALDKMHADWDGLEFKIMEYKDTGTYIVGATDDIQVTYSQHDQLQHDMEQPTLCM